MKLLSRRKRKKGGGKEKRGMMFCKTVQSEKGDTALSQFLRL